MVGSLVVGALVGDIDGAAVGPPVGAPVGAIDGAAVGAPVGALVVGRPAPPVDPPSCARLLIELGPSSAASPLIDDIPGMFFIHSHDCVIAGPDSAI